MRITAKNVRKTYGDVTALDGLTLTIPAETTFGVLGTNGAGKTTLFELLAGLDRPDSGRLTVGGLPVSESGLELRERIGYLPERVGFPPGLTGREILTFHAQMRGHSREHPIDEVLETVGLSIDAANRSISGYSNGMRRRLGLAGALLGSPDVLLLDEPTAGLDPRGVAEFHRIVDRIREQTDATVVLSSHVLSEVKRLCDRVVILHDGCVVAAGTIDDLIGSTDMTVSLQPADTTMVSELQHLADDIGETRTNDGAVTVTCPPMQLPALFASLENRVELSAVSIEHHGLEAAFHEAIPTEVDA